MLFLLVVFTVLFGIWTFARALKHSWEQWYYGRINRKTFERWRNERR